MFSWECNYIFEISTLPNILVRLSLLVEIYEEFGKKMSFNIIFGFEALESLLKKLENFTQYSTRGTELSTTTSMMSETV